MKLITIGAKFGRLTVIEEISIENRIFHNKGQEVLVECDCGMVKQTPFYNLVRKKRPVLSCGCLHSEIVSKQFSAALLKHGQAGYRSKTKRIRPTPEYKTWEMIKQRCYNPNFRNFQYWGGRGIVMCAGWRNSSGAFLTDLGPRPNGYSIDRIDNDGHYSCGKCDECIENEWPMNVRWATRCEQANNTSKNK